MATNNAVNTTLFGQTGTGSFVGAVSPTISLPSINQIIDSNGNAILGFTPQLSSVDYIRIINSPAGGIPAISVAGATPNKGILLLTKGTGMVAFSSESVTPIHINSGTANQHVSTFTFANTINTNNFTFPDASGIIALTQGSGGLKSFQVFTSGAGTYTKPAGITSILVELVGGNGGGGGASAALLGVSAGGGGGAGGYVRSYIASAAASYSYSVGALGTGGASGTNDGGNGGNTTFSTFTAGGGLGGDGANNGGTSLHPGGAGGTATGGNLINTPGSPGSPGIGLAGHCIGGAGANSYFGGGAIAPWGTSGTGNGIAASANSGGGSGGFAFGIGNASGGAGSAGIIVVWEFA